MVIISTPKYFVNRKSGQYEKNIFYVSRISFLQFMQKNTLNHKKVA